MSDSTSSDKDLAQLHSLLNNPHPVVFNQRLGRTGAKEFTSFQLQILFELYDSPEYGLAIKRGLEAVYGEDVNHGRLYPNLDTLVDTGYVEKSELDKRTNEYELTQKGRQQVEDYAANILHQLGLPEGDIQSLLDQLSASDNDDAVETVSVTNTESDQIEVPVSEINAAADSCATVGDVADELDVPHGRARTLLVHVDRHTDVSEGGQR